LNGHSSSAGVVEVKATAAEIAALWLKCYENSSIRPKCTEPKYFNNASSSWNGTTQRSLELFKNTAPIPKQTLKLDLTRQLGTLGNATKRERFYSDLDGEFNYDRRALDNCFDASRRVKQDRCITLNCFFSFLGDTSAKTINQYGEIVYSVAIELERLGYRTEINLVNSCRDLVEGKQYGFDAQLLIKRPSEYLDRRIFRFFTVEFFRRAIFTLRAYAVNSLGLKCSYGMGYTAAPNEQRVERGMIFLTPTNGPQDLGVERLASLIKAAIK
jgi:hypothetical protein